jgi:hypothetical protein
MMSYERKLSLLSLIETLRRIFDKEMDGRLKELFIDLIEVVKYADPKPLTKADVEYFLDNLPSSLWSKDTRLDYIMGFLREHGVQVVDDNADHEPVAYGNGYTISVSDSAPLFGLSGFSGVSGVSGFSGMRRPLDVKAKWRRMDDNSVDNAEPVEVIESTDADIDAETETDVTLEDDNSWEDDLPF